MESRQLTQEVTIESLRTEILETFNSLSLPLQRLLLIAFDKSNNGQNPQAFKQALIDHAAEFGLDAELFQNYPA